MLNQIKIYIDTLVSKQEVSKEELDHLYNLTKELSKIPLRVKERESIVEYADKLNLLGNSKTKNLIYSLLMKISNHYVRDYNQYLSRRDKQSVSDVLELILDAKKVVITGFTKEEVDHMLDIVRDIKDEDLENSKELVLIYNIYFRDRVQGRPVPLRGGGAEPLNVDFLKISLKIKHLRFSDFIIFTPQNTNKRTFVNKLSKLLTHIYLSKRDFVPIPRNFILDNGYEPLTSYTLLDNFDGKLYHSLEMLTPLGLAYVFKYKKGQSREISLTPLGKSIIGVLSLGKSRHTFRDITLEPGDLTNEKKNYSHYIVSGIIPNIPLIDSFLKALTSYTVNLNYYTDRFKEIYPIVTYTKDQYIQYILDNIDSIQADLDPNIDAVCNYYRDVFNLTSGYESVKKYTIEDGRRDLYLTYTSVWKLSYTGRLFQRYGVQGLTRCSKSIVHSENINYDIPSSQLKVLYQYLEDMYTLYSSDFTEEDLIAYEEMSWLDRYANDREYRNTLMEEIHIEPNEWKQAVYSVVFGSDPESHYKKTSINLIAFRAMKKDIRFDRSKYDFYLLKLNSLVELWMKYSVRYRKTYKLPSKDRAVLDKIIKDYKLDYDVDDFIFNGVNFCHKDDESISTKKHFSSFMLQGLESSFILYLIKLVPDIVISYEFDGVVVNKPIPYEVLDKAKRLSGFRYGTVVVKDFV